MTGQATVRGKEYRLVVENIDETLTARNDRAQIRRKLRKSRLTSVQEYESHAENSES